MEMNIETFTLIVDQQIAQATFQFEMVAAYGSEIGKVCHPILQKALEEVLAEGEKVYGAELIEDFRSWLQQKMEGGRKVFGSIAEEMKKEGGSDATN